MAEGRDSIFTALRRFREAWVSHGWSWDRRFECAASTFDVMRTDEARSAVASAFSYRWDHRTIRTAPDIIADVAEATGGVRSDQILFAMDEVAGMTAYGLWWPWGGEGTNISLRVGLAGGVDFYETIELRQIFGVMDD